MQRITTDFSIDPRESDASGGAIVPDSGGNGTIDVEDTALIEGGLFTKLQLSEASAFGTLYGIGELLIGSTPVGVVCLVVAAAVLAADLILFVVDVREGIAPLDQEVGRFGCCRGDRRIRIFLGLWGGAPLQPGPSPGSYWLPGKETVKHHDLF